jgi:hypothetical protein
MLGGDRLVETVVMVQSESIFVTGVPSAHLIFLLAVAIPIDVASTLTDD